MPRPPQYPHDYEPPYERPDYRPADRSPPPSPAKSNSWALMALVFLGAAIGAFLVYPMIRGAVVDDRPYYHEPDGRRR
jgi:hypothetical protein